MGVKEKEKTEDEREKDGMRGQRQHRWEKEPEKSVGWKEMVISHRNIMIRQKKAFWSLALVVATP